MNGLVWAAPAAVGAALALLAIWGSLRFLRRRRLIADIPTSKAEGVFIGFVELKGTAESGSPLTSHLAEEACVHYAWSVEEHWSHTYTETYTDSDGKTKTRLKTDSGWKTLAGDGEMIAFYVADETGAVRVDPAGAKMEVLEIFSETCRPGDPLYYAKGPAEAVMYSTHERRFHEEGIPLGTALYVVGQARERDDVVAPEIAASPDAPMFLISTRTEAEVGSGMTGWAWFLGILAILLAAGGALMSASDNPDAAPWAIAGGAAGALAAWVVGWIWTAYNSLVNLRQRTRQAASLVDVELKRRADLIPNLVAAVEGLRGHERETQEEVAELRAQAGATRPGVSGPDPRALLPGLRAVVERYPELRAQEAFQALQEGLTETEQRLALARSYFNDIATFYNTRLERVPDRFLAALGAMKPAPLIAAAGFERAPVVVKC
ncbi:MAG TPA: LemA family protein [Planctomycetota bacterium]